MEFIRKSYLLLFAFSLSYASTEYITPSGVEDQSFAPGPSLEDVSENNMSDGKLKTDLSKETSFSKAITPITKNIDFGIAALSALALKYYPGLKLLPELSLIYLGLKHAPALLGVGAALWIVGGSNLTLALSLMLQHPLEASALGITLSVFAGALMKVYMNKSYEIEKDKIEAISRLSRLGEYEESYSGSFLTPAYHLKMKKYKSGSTPVLEYEGNYEGNFLKKRHHVKLKKCDDRHIQTKDN